MLTKVPTEYMKRFSSTPYNRKNHFVTPTQIIYHRLCLAYTPTRTGFLELDYVLATGDILRTQAVV